MDIRANPFQVAFAAVVSSGGSLGYTVQSTLDDVYATGFTASSANWINHSTVAAQSTTQSGNYAFPVNAIRITATGYVSGTVTLQVNQSQF